MHGLADVTTLETGSELGPLQALSLLQCNESQRDILYCHCVVKSDDPTHIPPGPQVTGPATADNGTYQGTGQWQQDREETQINGWQVPNNQAVSIFLKPSEPRGQWPLPQLAQDPVGLHAWNMETGLGCAAVSRVALPWMPTERPHWTHHPKSFPPSPVRFKGIIRKTESPQGTKTCHVTLATFYLVPTWLQLHKTSSN